MATFWENINSSSFKEWDFLDPSDDELKKFDFPFENSSSQLPSCDKSVAHLLDVNTQKVPKERSVTIQKEVFFAIKPLTISEIQSLKFKKDLPPLPSTLQNESPACEEKTVSNDMKDITSKYGKTYSRKKQSPLSHPNGKMERQFIDKPCIENTENGCSELLQTKRNEELALHCNLNISKPDPEVCDTLQLESTLNEVSAYPDYGLFDEIEVPHSTSLTEMEEDDNFNVSTSSIMQKINKSYQRTRKNLKNQIIGLNMEQSKEKTKNGNQLGETSSKSSGKEISSSGSESKCALNGNQIRMDLSISNSSSEAVSTQNEVHNNAASTIPKLTILDMVKKYSENHKSPQKKKASNKQKQVRQMDIESSQPELDINYWNTIDPSSIEKAYNNKRARYAPREKRNSYNNTLQVKYLLERKSAHCDIKQSDDSGNSESTNNNSLTRNKIKKGGRKKTRQKEQKFEHLSETFQLSNSKSKKGTLGKVKRAKKKAVKKGKHGKLKCKSQDIYTESATQTDIEANSLGSNDSYKVNRAQFPSSTSVHNNSSPFNPVSIFIPSVVNSMNSNGDQNLNNSKNTTGSAGNENNRASEQNLTFPSCIMPSFSGIPNLCSTPVHDSSLVQSQAVNSDHACPKPQIMWLPVYGNIFHSVAPNQHLFDNGTCSLPPSLQNAGNSSNITSVQNSQQCVVSKVNFVSEISKQENSKSVIQDWVETTHPSPLEHDNPMDEPDSSSADENDSLIECRRSDCLKARDFLSFTDENIKFMTKSCLAKCRETANEWFSQYPSSKQFTVKEFCNKPEVMDVLLEFSIDCSNFKEPAGTCMGYEFPDAFQDNDLSSVVKDFVDHFMIQMFSSNVKEIYVPNIKILEFAYQNMNFLECAIVSEVFARSEMLKFEEVAAKLSIVALLVIFNAFRKREMEI